MADDFTGLTVDFKKTPEGSHYEFGVTAGGVWFTFGAISTGDVEARLYEAAQAETVAPATAPTA